MKTYVVNIYIASPGTPMWPQGGTSLPGHMYYSIDDGSRPLSFGFAPKVEGEPHGPGAVYRTDEAFYQDPHYVRTLEISEQQYKTLKEFGEHPERFGFDTFYRDARNNCVDFTWAALNRAGLHATHADEQHRSKPNHEGSLKPLRNVDDVQSIQPPMPKSPLNHETFNPLPERNWKQTLLSDRGDAAESQEGRGQDHPQHPDHAMLEQIRGHVRELDRTHGRAYDDNSERLSHSLLTLAKANGLSRVDQVALSEQTGSNRAAENAFVVQGRLDDPAHSRAHMKTELALQTPVAESNQRLEAVNQRVAQVQVQNPALVQQREAHGAPMMQA